MNYINHRSLHGNSSYLRMQMIILSRQIFTLYHINPLIQSRCHETENDDAHHDPIQFKDLTAIDDQISKPHIGCEKFSDDNAHKTQADVDFHVADQRRKVLGKDNLKKFIFFGAAKGFDQQKFVGIGGDKAGVQVNDRSKDGKQNGTDDDGFHVIAKPYDQHRCKRCFGQAVECNEVRFNDIGDASVPP